MTYPREHIGIGVKCIIGVLSVCYICFIVMNVVCVCEP